MLEKGNRRKEAEKSGSSISVTGDMNNGAMKTDPKQNQPVPDAGPVPDQGIDLNIDSVPAPGIDSNIDLAPAPDLPDTEKGIKQTKSGKEANLMHRPVQGETEDHGLKRHDPEAYGPEACKTAGRIRMMKDGEEEEERKRPRTREGNRVLEWKNQMTREIYYADVKISKKAFLNDSDKYIYLRMLQYNLKPFRTELYGFCVLDDRVRLLAGGQNVHSSTIRRLLEGTIEAYEDHLTAKGEHDLHTEGVIAWVHIVRIADEGDALGVLRYIHLTSSSEGYIRHAQDYWWSSYITYRKQGSLSGCSRYQKQENWPMLDTGFLVQYMERKVPGMSISGFHQCAEVMSNPIPECIRKGEFERMFLNSRDIILQAHATG